MRFVARRISSSSSMSCTRSSVRVRPRAPWMPQQLSNRRSPGGELKCAGATTLNEYRKYIEKDAALERRFQIVKVEAPTLEEAVQILKGLRSKYETHHKAKLTDEALEAAVRLSDRYITGRFLPDKAIDIMDEAG